MEVYDIIITVIFFIDIIINFNRVYFDKNNNYVTSRKKIAKNYLKFWFWVDFVSFIPFSLFFHKLHALNQGLKFLKLTKVFNLIHLLRFIKILKKAFDKSLKRHTMRVYLTQRTGKEVFYMQILSNALAIHFIACLIYYIPMEFSSEKNWVLSRGLENKSILEKYLFSLHFVVETFITVGYGEVPIK
jgi:hypothetical protein